MTHNYNVFKNLEDEETLYWLGFISSDGWIERVNKKPTSLGVKLQISDKNHLERLRLFTGTKAKVRVKKEKNSDMAVLVVGGRNSFVPFLVELGITPNKSKTLKVDHRLAKSRHFWRGVLDGDGCIKNYSPTKDGYTHQRFVLSLTTASLSFANQFLIYCSSNFSKEPNIRLYRDLYKVEYTSVFVKKVVKHIYGNSNVVLQRKKQDIDKILDAVPGKNTLKCHR